ncbi:2Fe-2S iron-sulfur cluster-binding protein [Kaarinaea lacus]
MSHQITLLPSNHQFEAAEHESLLEAALRSGINISYSCSSGGCGQCKARVVSGDHHPCRHYDYVIPEAEKHQDVVLLCSTAPRSAMVIQAHEAKTAADIPRQSIQGRVAKVERKGDDHILLHVRTPRSQTLRFLAGQHVTVTFAGVPPHDLAVASCPCNGMVLQFHLQRDDNEPFIRHVFQSVRNADKLLVEGPFGEFTLDEESKRPLVLVGHETGFAPLKSLIEHAIALDLTQQMMLFWISAPERQHYLSNYCRAWEDALDNFAFFPMHMPAQNGSDFSDVAQQIAVHSSVGAAVDLYLAGPAPMTSAVEQAYDACGAPYAHIAVTSTY